MCFWRCYAFYTSKERAIVLIWAMQHTQKREKLVFSLHSFLTKNSFANIGRPWLLSKTLLVFQLLLLLHFAGDSEYSNMKIILILLLICQLPFKNFNSTSITVHYKPKFIFCYLKSIHCLLSRGEAFFSHFITMIIPFYRSSFCRFPWWIFHFFFIFFDLKVHWSYHF